MKQKNKLFRTAAAAILMCTLVLCAILSGCGDANAVSGSDIDGEANREETFTAIANLWGEPEEVTYTKIFCESGGFSMGLDKSRFEHSYVADEYREGLCSGTDYFFLIGNDFDVPLMEIQSLDVSNGTADQLAQTYYNDSCDPAAPENTQLSQMTIGGHNAYVIFSAYSVAAGEPVSFMLNRYYIEGNGNTIIVNINYAADTIDSAMRFSAMLDTISFA